MLSKQTANKRKRTSNTPTLARSKRRRTTRLTLTNASEPFRVHGSASEVYWAAKRILKDNGLRYLVEWEGIDPGTRRPYESTWEPHNFVTPALEADWKETIAAQRTATRHALAEPDVSDETSSFLTRSERSKSLSAKQNGSTLQHRRTRACTLPIAATDCALTSPSALSTQVGLRLDTNITAGQAFVKQGLDVLAGSRDAKTCPSPAAVLTACARHTLKQNNLLEADTGGLWDPATSDWSVREPETILEREQQVRVANSMDTIGREQTDSITRVSPTPKPPSCGEVDQDYASRRYKNGCRTVGCFASSIIDSVDISPTSPSGAPRSTPEGAHQFSDELVVVRRPPREPSATASCSGLSMNQKRLQSTELAPQHIQLLVDEHRYSQRWTALSHEVSQRDIQSLQHHDACAVRPTYSNTTLASEPHIPMCRTDRSIIEREVTTKPMNGAAQVEPRGNKPPMKRVKTCQGYMNNIILRKNVTSSSLSSLSDQTPEPIDTHQSQNRSRSYDLAYILNSEPGLASYRGIHQESHTDT
ncbi:hypothetical protein AA0114_g13011 [Alternaria tenuissima]|uniref:Chromo domain-containing protein n=1 Tax=Alternaria tenuissima TaxID=119927 RepID=A0A4Q4LXG4_9PLEO|nr:hypothetical protein AA0114_g13011 [Alternaria tenuissima]